MDSKQPASYARIRVCQASYGDCLALEWDSGNSKHDPDKYNRPKNMEAEYEIYGSSTRMVMLIDGGPGSHGHTGSKLERSKPYHNMFRMLNMLLPTESKNGLECLVTTHDDADHMNGIYFLLKTLCYGGIGEYKYELGDKAVNDKIPPFKRIWHNSAFNVLKGVTGGVYERTKVETAQGYFDTHRDLLHGKVNNMPDFNEDFKMPGDKKPCLIGYQGQKAPNRTYKKTLGKLDFRMLSPSMKQLEALADLYGKDKKDKDGNIIKPNEKVPKGDALGSDVDPSLTDPKPLSNEENIFAKMSTNLHGKMTADPSVKNGSSLAFVVEGNRWTGSNTFNNNNPRFSAVFLGDANATNTFLDVWDGKALEYDVMKVAHHGSCHNNYWEQRKFDERVEYLKGKNIAVENQSEKIEAVLKRWEDSLRSSFHDEDIDLLLREQRKVSLFFNNVRAKKYIISSSHDRHPNPHISTLIGIIARAVLLPSKGGVDIYLTNPMHDQTWALLATFWFQCKELLTRKESVNGKWTSEYESTYGIPLGQKMPEMVMPSFDSLGTYYRIWELDPKRAFGTVFLDPEGDRSNNFQNGWCRADPTCDFYLDHFRRNYTIPAPVNVSLKSPDGSGKKDKVADRTGSDLWKVKVLCGNCNKMSDHNKRTCEDACGNCDGEVGIPGHKQIDCPLGCQICGHAGHKANVCVKKRSLKAKKDGKKTTGKAKLKDGSVVNMGYPNLPDDNVHDDFEPTKTKKPKPDALQISTLISKMSAIDPYLNLIGFQNPRTAPGLRELSWDTRIRFGLIDRNFGKYSESKDKLTILNGIQELFHQFVVNGNLALNESVDLIGDLALSNADLFFRTLPLVVFQPVSPLSWIIKQDTVLTAFQTSRMNFKTGDSPLQQVTFRVECPENREIPWIIPDKSALLGKTGLFFSIVGGVDITIFWPLNDSKRMIYGSFKGYMGANRRTMICDYLVAPASKKTPQYHFRFATNDFQEDNIDLGLIDILEFVTGYAVGIEIDFGGINIPGVKELREYLNDNLRVRRPGFILERSTMHSPDFGLKQISGTFEIDSTFKPFPNIPVEFERPRVQLSVENPLSNDCRSILIHLYQTIDIDGFPVPLEFETRRSVSGGLIYEFSFVPQAEKPVTLMGAVNVLALGSLNDFEWPTFIRDAMNALSLESFRVGWIKQRNQNVAPSPSYVEFTIRMDSLVIIPNILDFKDAAIEIRIDNPTMSGNRRLTCAVSASLWIAQTAVEVRFTYGEGILPRPLDNPFGHLERATPGIHFEFRCPGQALTLGMILSSFSSGENVLPSPFDTIAENVGLVDFSIDTELNSNKEHELSFISLEVVLTSETVDLFEGFSMRSPKLFVACKYPPDPVRRVLGVQITTKFVFDDGDLQANVSCLFGTENHFILSLTPSHEFPVFKLLELFTERLGDALHVEIPVSFGRLDSIMLEKSYISFSKTAQENFKMSSLGFGAHMNTEFLLWDSPRVCLDNFYLRGSYTRGLNTIVSFYAELDVGDVTLSATVEYHDQKQSKLLGYSGTLMRKNVPDSKPLPGKSWIITASYEGEISLLNIISRLSGVDLATLLIEYKLPKVKDKLDIRLSNLELCIQKGESQARIAFSGDTNTFLKKFKFSAYKLQNWGIAVAFDTQNDLLSLAPSTVATSFGESVKVNNTSLCLFIGAPDSELFSLGSRFPQRYVGLAVSTTLMLDFTEVFVLSNWLQKVNIDISGLISDKIFSLGVGIGKLKAFSNRLEIDGSLVVEYHYDRKKPFVGIEGSFKLDFPSASSSLIEGSATFGLDLFMFGLVFEATIPGPVNDLFGYKGLTVKKLAFTGTFPPAQAMMPSEFGFSAEISHKKYNDVTGMCAVRVCEADPTASYFSGFIKNLDIPKIVSIFAQDLEKDASDPLFMQIQGTGIILEKLELEIIPKDMIGVGGFKNLKQGIYFECDISFAYKGTVLWSGYAKIDISLKQFHVFATMSPIEFSKSYPRVFCLRRWKDAPGRESDPKLDVPDRPYRDHRILEDGPVFKVSTLDKENPVFISAEIVLFGMEHKTRLKVHEEGFEFDFEASFGNYIKMQAMARCKYESNIFIEAWVFIDFQLDDLPLAGGLAKVIKDIKKTSRLLTCESKLDFSVGWTKNYTGLNLFVESRVMIFDEQYRDQKEFVITAEEAEAIKNVCDTVLNRIKQTVAREVDVWLDRLGIKDSIEFLRRNSEAVGTEIVRHLEALNRSVPITDIALEFSSYYHLPLAAQFELFKTLGVPAPAVIANITPEAIQVQLEFAKKTLPPQVFEMLLAQLKQKQAQQKAMSSWWAQPALIFAPQIAFARTAKVQHNSILNLEEVSNSLDDDVPLGSIGLEDDELLAVEHGTTIEDSVPVVELPPVSPEESQRQADAIRREFLTTFAQDDVVTTLDFQARITSIPPLVPPVVVNEYKSSRIPSNFTTDVEENWANTVKSSEATSYYTEPAAPLPSTEPDALTETDTAAAESLLVTILVMKSALYPATEIMQSLVQVLGCPDVEDAAFFLLAAGFADEDIVGAIEYCDQLGLLNAISTQEEEVSL